MMEQVRLCAACPMENWLSSSMNQIQGWTIVQASYSRALEQGPLREEGVSPTRESATLAVGERAQSSKDYGTIGQIWKIT